LILGGAVALILGFAVAIPILVAYYTPTTSLQIEVDLVYAYLSVHQFNQNVTGLWINSSDPLQQGIGIISFFMVLNITNRSDRFADLTDFLVIAGPSISVTNTTVAHPGGYSSSTGVSAENPVVFYTLGDNINWYSVWEPHQSRLIAVTGSVGTRGMSVIARSLLENGFIGPIYLYASARGYPRDGGLVSSGYSLKYVRLQAFGTEFLYNAVLSNNQRWSLDQNGIDVYIVTIS
jgi:hypothetical protein